MKKLWVFLICTMAFLRGSDSVGSNGDIMHEVRTYMSYTWPVDPAKTITLAEMDLSYALGTTLVEWGPSKQIVAGAASKWEPVGENTLRFTLRDGLKWSDGEEVTSEEVKLCLERGMAAHPEDWRSLHNIVAHIVTPSYHVVEFKLRAPGNPDSLLGKLTESNFAILKINHGKVDVTKTTGPFYATKLSENELELQANPNYIHHSEKIASTVIIRQTPKGMSPQDILLQDKWPNLVQLSSIIPDSTFQKYKSENFDFWKRPTDRVFIFQMGKRTFNEDGKALFRFLYSKIKRENLVLGLSGYDLTAQLFPRGYPLHDPTFDKAKVSMTDLPATFKNRPLEIMLSPERVSPILQKNIESEITRITGHKPKIIQVQMNEVMDQYKNGQYDFYVGTVGLADPDPEGLMSFYFENDFKIVPEVGENFIDRLNTARRQKSDETRVANMRAILTDATYKGHIVPLFHLSTVGIARGDIDLSQVPITDESVTLSKIRFKGVTN